MKRAGTFWLCLAGGFALSAVARADDLAVADNPYATIVTRNVFGLLPPPTNVPDVKQPDPPVKITVNGIMNLLGQEQALFKTTENKAGAKEQSYMLSEGQQQNDIEVTKIDEKTRIVTFNNHGIIQELPLANTPSSGPSSGGAGGSAPNFPGFPGRPGMGGGNGGNMVTPFGARGGGFQGRNPSGFGGNQGGNPGGSGGNYPNGSANSGRGPDVNENGVYQPPASGLSPLAAAAIIESQRTEDNPTSALLPPTRPDLLNQLHQTIGGEDNGSGTTSP